MKRQSTISPAGRSRRRRRFRGILAALALLFLPPAVPHILGLGYPGPPPRPADALMVLSGGEGRIAVGYRAWSSGAATEIYILGAGRDVPLTRLVPPVATLTPAARSRIHAEGWSENTLENAFSAMTAAEERKFSSVVLVTSDYHVPRAWIAFRKILPPRVALYVLPVRSEGWASPGAAWRTARRYFLEGWKYWGYRVLLRWE
ncbi:MAG TPA: YdcF family protein [Candidatus Deferrimicrobiaceae bacterium]